MNALTREEQEFATVHHDEIYKFLRKRKLNIDEFYDVAVFGFLRAVKKYHVRPELRQYQFSTIAWSAMRTEIYNHNQYKRRQKRLVKICDINKPINNYDGLFISNLIASPENQIERADEKLFWVELTSMLTKTQRYILKRKADGVSNVSIAKECGISVDKVAGIFDKVRSLLINEYQAATLDH